jgi:hypothetical protein
VEPYLCLPPYAFMTWTGTILCLRFEVLVAVCIYVSLAGCDVVWSGIYATKFQGDLMVKVMAISSET